MHIFLRHYLLVCTVSGIIVGAGAVAAEFAATASEIHCVTLVFSRSVILMLLFRILVQQLARWRQLVSGIQ